MCPVCLGTSQEGYLRGTLSSGSPWTLQCQQSLQKVSTSPSVSLCVYQHIAIYQAYTHVGALGGPFTCSFIFDKIEMPTTCSESAAP